MNRLEKIILKNLVFNEEYTRKVLPFLKNEYFLNTTERLLFNEIFQFTNKYKNLPTTEALIIGLNDNKKINSDEYTEVVELINEIKEARDTKSEEKWLVEQTEKFCQDKAIYIAIMESVSILDNKKNDKSKGEIPKLLSDALGVSFDNNIGHDYVDDYSARYDAYHKVESRIRFDLDMMNKITKGGLPVKTLNICLAGCVHPETKVKIRYRKRSAN